MTTRSWEVPAQIPSTTGGGTDTTDAQGSESTCDGPASGCDLEPPTFESLSVVPQTVDTSAGPQTITVTIRYTEDLSGLELAGGLSGPLENQWTPDSGDTNMLASGTILDCTIRFERVIPASTRRACTASGVSTRVIAWATTRTRPSRTSLRWGSPPRGRRPERETPPRRSIDSFSFTPNHVDTSAAEREITVRAHVSDELSGVVSWGVFFRSESGRVIGEGFNHYSRVSGDEFDGTYEDVLPVPRFSEEGTWSLDSVYARDRLGNILGLDHDELVAMGADPSFEQNGAGDITPPHLESFSFSPTSVDTTSSYQTITVTAQLTDDSRASRPSRRASRARRGKG